MIDHAAHVTQTVKDELAKACSRLGIDKMQAGFAIGGFGSVGILTDSEGNMGMGPSWTINLSLRSLLLGQPPIAASIPVPGVLPTDDEIRLTVASLLPQISEARDKQFRGEA